MSATAKWLMWSLAGFVALLLIGIGLAGEGAPQPRAPGPDLEAALAACREDLAVHHAQPDTVQGPEVAPWSHRMPGDQTRRPR